MLSDEGHLITNAHVVGDATAGEAAFGDGTTARFEVVGADALSDLAVVRADRAVPSPPDVRRRRLAARSARSSSRSATRSGWPAR